MRSNAYNDFIKQINATGYEKAQGFNPNLLENIDASERDEVEKIILELFRDGDHQCIMFLPKLSIVDGISLLKEELLKWNIPNIVNAEIAHILWKVTGETYYEDLLIENLKIKNTGYRSIVVKYLLECKPSGKLSATFESLCQHDSDKLVRYHAAIGLIYCAGLLKDPLDIDYQHPLRGLIVGLSCDLGEERQKAKAQLDVLVKTMEMGSNNPTI